MNKIILLGRIANEPELSYTQGGTPVCKFSLAVQRDMDKQKADFFFCTTFGKLAQSVADYCPKGRQVLLDGRVEINVTQEQNGSRTFVNVIANTVEFLAMPQNQQAPNYNQQQQQPQRQERYNAAMDSYYGR